MNKKIFFVFFFMISQILIFSQTMPYEGEKPGNEWYSNNSFYIQQGMELGVSGSTDFLNEIFLFEYTIKSKNRHAFSIRTYHMGYTNGIITGTFEYFNFAIMGGFEYMYKIFSGSEGVFFFTDIGGCNRGVAVNVGFGLGSRVRDGFEFNLLFLQDVGFFSRMDFYFLFFDAFIVHGRFGIDFKYQGYDIQLFTFLNGAYLGFSIKNYFRFELGGGFTINDNTVFNGFGSAIISMKFPR